MFARCLLTVPRDESAHKDIETASHRVDDDARVNLKQGVQERYVMGHKELAASLRVRLSSKFIWAVTLPTHESLLHDLDLGFGPIEDHLGFEKVGSHSANRPARSWSGR